MLVKVEHVDRSVNWGAKDSKTGKPKPKYDGAFDKLVPGLSSKTGRLMTGLTSKDEKDLEKDLRLEPGELSPSSSYWDLFYIIIPNEGLTLNTDVPDEKLKYLVLKSDPEVATSMETFKTKMGCRYLMTSEEAVSKEKNTKRDIIAKAFARYASLTSSEIADALYMFGKNTVDTDPEVCKNRLGEIVEETPDKFLTVIEDTNFKDKVWLLKLVRLGIVRKQGSGTGLKQPLLYEDTLLGNSLDEAITFLKDKENSNVYIGLQKVYESEFKHK